MLGISSRPDRRRAGACLIEPLESRVLLSTIYYISPTGSDGNNGTSSSTPWASVAKVDATVFQPGDQILFQRGGNWYGQLIASGSGTVAAPITYGAYGSASSPLPTFWGSDVVPDNDFTLVSGSVYTFPTSAVPTGQVYYVYANHQFLSAATSASSMPSDSFYISGSTVYVNTGGVNPAGGAVVYTATDRGAGSNANDAEICSNGFSNLVFENLTGEETAEDAPGGNISGGIPDGYVIRVQGGSNVQLLNDTAINGGKHNIGAIDTTGFVGQGLLAEGCMPGLPFGNATALVAYSDLNQTGDTYQWINCTVENYDPSQPAFITHEDTSGDITSILLQNLVALGSQLALETEPGEAITVNGGLIQNSNFDDYGSNVMINGLEMTGSGAQIVLYGSDNTVQNCVISGSSQDGAVQSMGAGNLIRFNTFSMNSFAGAAIDLTSAASSNVIYGNMITGTANVFTDPSANSLSMNDDFFDNTPGAPVFSYDGQNRTLAQFQSLGFETGGLTGNPQFVNSAADNFQLSSTSPAINQVPTASISGIPTDFLGNPRLSGPEYDMGAFEYQTPVTPSVASVVINANLPSLAGVQRSMVDSIVYTFSQAVNITGPGAFTLTVHPGQTGAVPSLALTAVTPNPDGSSTQWVVTFTGNGVVGNSIANGVYDIAMNAADVTLDGFPAVTGQPRPTDTFYRLYGDVTGSGRVNTADYFDFLGTFGLKAGNVGYLAAFDFGGTGAKISTADYFDFLTDFGLHYSGFTATI